jgi:hypothetical protein
MEVLCMFPYFAAIEPELGVVARTVFAHTRAMQLVFVAIYQQAKPKTNA